MSNTLSSATKSPIITYAVSNEAENFMRMCEIDDTLNSIFTLPKELNYILCKIDKIYALSSFNFVAMNYMAFKVYKYKKSNK